MHLLLGPFVELNSSQVSVNILRNFARNSKTPLTSNVTGIYCHRLDLDQYFVLFQFRDGNVLENESFALAFWS